MYAPILFPPAPARVRERTQTNDTLTLTTWLTARERQQVEAANCGCLRFIHREAATDLGPDLAEGSADAALVSVALLDRNSRGSVAALVRGFPAHLVAALVSEADEAQVVPATLELGRVGVRVVLDVRKADGWSNFRRTLDPRRQPDGFMRTALTTVLADVGGQQVPCARFFCAAFAPRTRSAKQLAAALGVHPSTLMSRFYRAGVPSPKTYLTYARLVWAAHLSESPALTIGDIADRLEASSPHSFGRTVRLVLALTPTDFRRRYNGPAMLERFRHQLIAPYRDKLRTLDPVGETGAVGTGAMQYGREGGREGRAA
jgi:AraC-like DNA-binding protein